MHYSRVVFSIFSFLFLSSTARHAGQVANYEFQNTLASTNSAASLVDLGSGSYVTDSVFGESCTVFSFAEQTGLPYTCALSSCTAALDLLWHELAVSSGDLVLCSNLTFVASIAAAVHRGAVPVFIGSEPESWTMSPDLLKEALVDARSAGKMPKAVVAVDLVLVEGIHEALQARKSARRRCHGGLGKALGQCQQRVHAVDLHHRLERWETIATAQELRHLELVRQGLARLVQ